MEFSEGDSERGKLGLHVDHLAVYCNTYLRKSLLCKFSLPKAWSASDVSPITIDTKLFYYIAKRLFKVIFHNL